MSRDKHLKIVIAVDGTCTIDAMNFTGPACQVATVEISSVLGGRALDQRCKPEFQLRERATESDKERTR